MKLNVKYLNLSPCGKYLGCHKNAITDEISEWVTCNKISSHIEGNYRNFKVVGDMSKLFSINLPYKFIDGFSPNPNKELHVGHLSNFIIANSISRLCGLDPIFIQNSVDNISNIHKDKITKLMVEHMYIPQEYVPSINSEIKLVEGINTFAGTKCIDINGTLKVGIKSDGNTSYLYEDISMIHHYKTPILYLTGKEQISHFDLLKDYCVNTFDENYVHHLPIGHVQVNGRKASTREGTGMYAEELIGEVSNMLGSKQLAWNVISGAVLSYDPVKDKQLDIKTFDNPRESVGLYLSYTMARIHKAGISMDDTGKFIDPITEFIFMKASQGLKPQLALNRLRLIAKELNLMYESGPEYYINNPNLDINIKTEYQNKLHDLKVGMLILGMKTITKV